MPLINQYKAACEEYYKMHSAANALMDLQDELIEIDGCGEVIEHMDKATILLHMAMVTAERRCKRIADAIKAECKGNGKEDMDRQRYME